jgi:hypothetical protein
MRWLWPGSKWTWSPVSHAGRARRAGRARPPAGQPVRGLANRTVGSGAPELAQGTAAAALCPADGGERGVVFWFASFLAPRFAAYAGC